MQVHRNHRIEGWRSLAVASLALLVAASARAGLPEPDILYYGVVSVGGVPQGAGSGHELKLRRGATVLARYELGDLAEADDYYVLRVKVESPLGGPISPGAAQLGEQAAVLVDDIEVGRVYLGARGRVTRMDLTGYASAGEVPDFDGDTIPDFRDLCWLSASQLDSDGNGIGDDCEASLHPGIVYSPAVEPGGPSGAGNDPDPRTGKGGVAYVFSLTQTEVTNADYMDFLNAVGGEDPNRLYSDAMAADPRGGIVREGVSGSYRYSVKPNMANKPVNYVSWLDAARYSNWLANGKPEGAQSAATTETGAFDLLVEDPGANAVFSESAEHSLPTENEWYKAAYYDPAGDAWWAYPTQSDTLPVPASSNSIGDVSNPGPHVANYASGASWAGLEGNVTSVGSAGSPSASGSYDQGGNVAEWLADDAQDGRRLARGGSYQDGASPLAADAADSPLDPAYEGPDVGLRVAVVPEPDATALAAAALLSLAILRVLAVLRARAEVRR